jgi:hypothetical protein
MASQIKVDQLAGAAGNTVTVPAGQTLDVLGTLDIDGGTLVLPNTVVTTTGTQTLTNKTLTAPKIGTSILDTNGNELALLTATGSAVNEFTLANAASGNAPKLSSTGETNVDLDLEAKGTGHITVRGNTNPGSIQLNCESNTHGQQIKSQPHSTNTTNIMLLPQGADSTLVSLVSADTLTNKTLTSPKIGTNILDTGGNELLKLTATGSAVNELTLANAATGGAPILSATGGDTNIGITLTPKGSGAVKLDLLTFPTVTGSADQVLTTNGSGVLSFVDNSGGTSWQAVKTGAYTAVAGDGVFVNTTSSAFTITLPASPTLGDEVSIVDYAGTFDSNNCTIGRNSQKIQGAAADLVVATERAGFTLAFTDGTQGWLLKNN